MYFCLGQSGALGPWAGLVLLLFSTCLPTCPQAPVLVPSALCAGLDSCPVSWVNIVATSEKPWAELSDHEKVSVTYRLCGWLEAEAGGRQSGASSQRGPMRARPSGRCRAEPR